MLAVETNFNLLKFVVIFLKPLNINYKHSVVQLLFRSKIVTANDIYRHTNILFGLPSYKLLFSLFFLLSSSKRRQAACGSGSKEAEAPQHTKHLRAKTQAGCQQALGKRRVSVCEEKPQYERTGPGRKRLEDKIEVC